MNSNIRLATIDDLDAINDIYNYEVLNGIATFDVQERTYEEAEAWFNEHDEQDHPIFVYEQDDEVIGYCSLSTYRKLDAYAQISEISLYIANDFKSQGYGRLLANYVLEYAKENTQNHNIIAVITSENLISINLFFSLDFKDGGTIEECGKKFGKLLGITNLYRILN